MHADVSGEVQTAAKSESEMLKLQRERRRGRGTLRQGENILGNSAGVCAGKQMLQTITTEQEPRALQRQHSQLPKKARKLPSGEVITQEALLQGRHRWRL